MKWLQPVWVAVRWVATRAYCAGCNPRAENKSKFSYLIIMVIFFNFSELVKVINRRNLISNRVYTSASLHFYTNVSPSTTNC